MKAFVTSIREKTTEICCWQLRRYGFEVILLDEQEEWFKKYKRFILMADETCLRIDADIIVNKNIMKLETGHFCLMTQFHCFDFYKNNTGVCSPVLYHKDAIENIRKNIDSLDRERPETSAWRLPAIVKHTFTSNLIVGMHGFFQFEKTMEMAKANKINRKQIEDYDFELVDKLKELWP
ncbi:MAG: hypothetical protein UV20_C0009G0042 [Candidatus Magasanikbacteria bacterium GW2011_GWA2_42_32]|uniref:Nucleotide-diphospho-sugar transferase domain-containing protein n=1 Tax=Candidatus Magasanikbacteria bacterium GW2011_GWA2_42_32 TaxID=1619039 RepID=A0A0G1D3I4_9BACT|nr:MAG: hypothetical protein UV20_C0009G0042 [Candidatus Magasanikbacteria bacterium GW2011_GWA2_42_32]HBX15882.1 hypothetical protein [Candidatus Magasanikbacteria bacterium]